MMKIYEDNFLILYIVYVIYSPIMFDLTYNFPADLASVTRFQKLKITQLNCILDDGQL